MKNIKIPLILCLSSLSLFASNIVSIEDSGKNRVIKYKSGLEITVFKHKNNHVVKEATKPIKVLSNKQILESSAKSYVVNTKQINLYNKPNLKSNKVGQLKRNDSIDIVHVNKYGWGKNTKSEWVRMFLLRKEMKKFNKKDIKKTKFLNKDDRYIVNLSDFNKKNNENISVKKEKVLVKKEKNSNNIEEYIVNKEKIFIYTNPYDKNISKFSLKRGEILEIEEKDKYGWYKVKNKGWVKGYLLKKKKKFKNK